MKILFFSVPFFHIGCVLGQLQESENTINQLDAKIPDQFSQQNEQNSLLRLDKKTTDCGGNCPRKKCTQCQCGTTSNYVDIPTWCQKTNIWDQICCQCIAFEESKGNGNAVNHNNNGSDDVGLWQINSKNWGKCSGGKAPCDLNDNLECAKKVYKWGGNSWKLWNTYKTCKKQNKCK